MRHKSDIPKNITVRSETVDRIQGDMIILLGERSNGKSFAVKELLIKRAYEYKEQFGYLRRYSEDVKDYLASEYFGDVILNKNGHEYIKEWTNGEYTTISAYKKSIYFANYDEESDKIIRGQKIGRMFGLSASEHYKSLAFPEIRSIIYEEFVTNYYYLPNEPKLLLNFVSTIFRNEKGKVYCVGNKVSRINPYFGEWQLNHIDKQKIGSIDTYHVKNEDSETLIAVYMTDTMKVNSGMFFGNAAKAITGGEWETDEQPHLPGHVDDYSSIYKIVFVYGRTAFLCDFIQSKANPDRMTWYITPKTSQIQKGTRVVSDKYSIDPLWTIGFKPLTDAEATLFNMMKQGRICYMDNLTGTEFKQCYNMV